MQKRLVHALATLALAAAPVVALQTAAVGQEYPGGGAGRSEFAPGQPIALEASRGSFDGRSRGETVVQQNGAGRGSAVAVTSLPVDTWIAAADGSAQTSFVLPELSAGAATVVMQGVKNGRPAAVTFPIEVVGATGGTGAGTDGTGADGTGTDGSGVGGSTTDADGSVLPRTGADAVVPMLATGIALVLAGGVVVAVARKRRDDLDRVSAV